jgi:hypothetical protein
MRGLSASQVLEVWERGLYQGLVGRALELAAAACPGTSIETLSALNVGQRDAILLSLRESTFGSEMYAIVACARCGTQIELAFTAAEVRAGAAQPPDEVAVTVQGYDLRLRLPNSLDLAAVTASEPERSRGLLLERCLIEATHAGAPATAGHLPPAVIEEAARLMGEADPQADVQLAVSCPGCGDRWRAAFDVVSFLWSEIEMSAARLLREIHILASAYGWPEREILALGNRRQFYLEMVGA